MDKCFVLRLKETVPDNTLPILSRSSFVMRYFDNAPQNLYGVDLEVSEPTMLYVDGSYFTDVTGTANYGTSILYSGPDFYIKKPNGENATVTIGNKFAVTKFIAKLGAFSFNGQNLTAVDMLYTDTLSESKDATEVNIGSASIQWDLKAQTTFAKLVKLSILYLGRSYYSAVSFNINELARNQINAGRDYSTYPTLKVDASKDLSRYYNGSSTVMWPSPTMFIVFKSGGYELHQDTADGTLLYDSTQ